MLFNSYIFILVFLPVVLAGFHVLGKMGGHRVSISWLVAASLFFYGWWNPAYLGLILASILFNYGLGVLLGDKESKALLTFGILINISLLGYFKYANFFVENINNIFSMNIGLAVIMLPLAISFFTFQQIAYLVDAYRGITREYSFLHYCLFVTFFPQLIAGPIVHHKEMLPQFSNEILSGLKSKHVAIGLVIFILGLFKKVVLADNLAVYASPVFDAAQMGVSLTIFEAWGGALAYTFQLYFDFSGYSDMAIGLARMFGIVLPINFYSPYKATSIIEFWRRWHITLSRFLRDYLYIPLGGNRNGQFKRFSNVMITMLLGGLWHGAGWTFIIWGVMHGAFLIINQVWRLITKVIFKRKLRKYAYGFYLSGVMTFLAVLVAWVMFRADTVKTALTIYSAMLGQNGFSLPVWSQDYLQGLSGMFTNTYFTYEGPFKNGVFGDDGTGVLLLLAMMLVVWFAPNTLEIMRRYNPALNLATYLDIKKRKICWRFSISFAFLLAILTLISLLFMSSPSEFLYFQF